MDLAGWVLGLAKLKIAERGGCFQWFEQSSHVLRGIVGRKGADAVRGGEEDGAVDFLAVFEEQKLLRLACLFKEQLYRVLLALASAKRRPD
jgi:hypothetical protein